MWQRAGTSSTIGFPRICQEVRPGPGFFQPGGFLGFFFKKNIHEGLVRRQGNRASAKKQIKIKKENLAKKKKNYVLALAANSPKANKITRPRDEPSRSPARRFSSSESGVAGGGGRVWKITIDGRRPEAL
jgi:hypothetical protein